MCPVPFASLKPGKFLPPLPNIIIVENRGNLKQLFLPHLHFPEVQETEREGMKVRTAEEKD